MVSNLQTEHLQELDARINKALAFSISNPIWGLDTTDLELMATGHKIGVNRSGWQNPYLATDPRSYLLEYQFRSWRDDSRFKAYCFSRQTGKDFTMEGEAVEDCNARQTEWLVGAPSERQALDSLDQAKAWAEAFKLYIEDITEERMGSTSQTLLKAAEITFQNGSRIRAVPGRPDTVRGRSANVLLTEIDFFDNPLATWRAILPSITNPLRGGLKKVRVGSTPNGKSGLLYKIFGPDASEVGREKKMKWSRHTVTIFHAVLMGLPVDWQEIRDALDDPDGWLQEFLCQFLDSSNVLLPYEIIQLAESFSATEQSENGFWDATGTQVYCGIDFGRTNDPTVCWTFEDIGGLLMTREVLVLKDMATPDQQEQLRRRIRRSNRVSFDYTGPGIGLGDYLVKEFGEYKPAAHEFGKIELCTFTAGLKRELFPKLRHSFEAPTRIRIPISTEIREDLHAMRQIIHNGQYSYEAPHTKAGHSDRCTALALAVRAAAEPSIPLECIAL